MSINFVSTSNQNLTAVTNFDAFIPGTVCFWVRPSSITNNKQIFFTSTRFDCRLVSGNMQFRLHRGASSNTNTTFDCVLNTLYHFTATWKQVSTDSTIEIFVDAVSNISQAKTLFTPSPTSDVLNIGSVAAGIYFDGTLEDLRFYNRILPLTEIEAIYYSRGTDNIAYGLVNRWPMIAGKGVGTAITGTGVVKDFADPGNHLTPGGSPTYSDSVLKYKRRLNI